VSNSENKRQTALPNNLFLLPSPKKVNSGVTISIMNPVLNQEREESSKERLVQLLQKL
jgi:hypothetical protein